MKETWRKLRRRKSKSLKI